MKVKSLSIVALITALMVVPAATASAQGEQSDASFFEASVNGSGPPSEPEPGASGQGWQTMDGARSEGVVVEAGDRRASGLLTAITNSTEFLLADGGIVVERDTFAC